MVELIDQYICVFILCEVRFKLVFLVGHEINKEVVHKNKILYSNTLK